MEVNILVVKNSSEEREVPRVARGAKSLKFSTLS